ncbi:kinase-like domain, phloem protein 2-like protein, partial [Tanacetum coccineum]
MLYISSSNLLITVFMMLKERSIVAAEAQGTSSNHKKVSVTSIYSVIESHVSKKTMSSLTDLSSSELSFLDIESATNSFADENILRKYMFGRIFKGRLLHSEIDIIAKTFYIESKRLKICAGIADALSCIHYDVGRDFSVIHCNIRSSEIFLDAEWEPKLSGFKFALKNTVARRHRLLLTRDLIENVYLDPKYKKTGGVTHKSDVYSFGVVLFEVLCGRSAVLPD